MISRIERLLNIDTEKAKILALKISQRVVALEGSSMSKKKKLKTNGTIDFINGQKGFLSKSIYNVIPKIKEMLIFPNYLMHTAYPFNIDGERRSFSFNVKIIFK